MSMLSALLCVDFLSLLISVRLAGTLPWAVLATDLAVGTWAWVQTKGSRRSPAVEAHARPGTSESGMFWCCELVLSFNPKR